MLPRIVVSPDILRSVEEQTYSPRPDSGRELRPFPEGLDEAFRAQSRRREIAHWYRYSWTLEMDFDR